jgi:hypothetical protein
LSDVNTGNIESTKARRASSIRSSIRLVNTTKPTARRAIELLVAAGVLAETTGRKRDRSYVYRGYLDRLRVGTELERESRSSA